MLINFLKMTKRKIIFIVFIILLVLINIELPYTINTPGGVIDINDRVNVKNAGNIGSLNMTYVRSIKATPLTLSIAVINPYWDIIKKEEYKTNNDAEISDLINLNASESNALITAFKYSNKKLEVKKQKTFVVYILENAQTDLKIGDEIEAIDNKKIYKKEEIKNYIQSKQNGDIVYLDVINNGIKYKRYAKIFKMNNELLIGLIFSNVYDLKTNPEVLIKFKDNEKGPSGGLMLALAIYSKIMNTNLTNNLKIAGTGTIDEDGNVGEIGGIKYKLKGAVDNKMDIFLCPVNNYEEAIKEKEKHNYKIKIYKVSTFKEAINYIKN
ncbi:MAG: hypothetical protein IJ715_00805 [Bacilli bacterium]|nr:hypothetical protein [Bacilli bacterium]